MRLNKTIQWRNSILGTLMMLAVAVIFAFPSNVGAQASPQSSSSLSFIPRKNYVIEPGKSVKDTLLIRNPDASLPLHLSLKVVDFTYADDSGNAKFLLQDGLPPTVWSLKSYLTAPQNVTIPAGSSKTIDISVAIPAGLGAGSYYSAIVYSSGSGQGGNVSLSASGVTLVFAAIPGKVTENLKLTHLGAYDSSATKPGYTVATVNEPLHIGYTLLNGGNVTEAPVGNIKLKYMFGGEQTIENINPNQSVALINQARTFTACIKSKQANITIDGGSSTVSNCAAPGLLPGMYTVSLDAFYGQNGNPTQEITGTAVFWYLPVWFTVTVVALLLIVAFLIWRFAVRRRHSPLEPKQNNNRTSNDALQ